MSDAELRKWAKKYELWRVLHLEDDDTISRCLICMRGRDVGGVAEDTCPKYTLRYNEIVGVMEIGTSKGGCMEWVKYV